MWGECERAEFGLPGGDADGAESLGPGRLPAGRGSRGRECRFRERIREKRVGMLRLGVFTGGIFALLLGNLRTGIFKNISSLGWMSTEDDGSI
jgi:hypothetical protein